MLTRTLISFLAACMLFATASHANPPTSPPANPPTDPRAELASKIKGTRAEDFHPTPIPGIYELTRGVEIAYVTADGNYALSGDLIELSKNDNLTETRRRQLRAKPPKLDADGATGSLGSTRGWTCCARRSTSTGPSPPARTRCGT